MGLHPGAFAPTLSPHILAQNPSCQMTISPAKSPEILPLGPDGVLVRLGLSPDETTVAAVQSLRDRIQTAADMGAFPGLAEIAGSLTSVLVRFDPGDTDRARITAALAPCIDPDQAAQPDDVPAAHRPHRRWTIPVALGGCSGPQWRETASAAGLSEQQALDNILSTPLRVLAIGFAPGLPYLGLLPPAWDIPRQTEITPQVPRGALVAAIRQFALFPNPSPTGWRHIGQTAFRGFDPQRDPSILLRAGDEIRFAHISTDTLRTLEANGDSLGGATCETLT